MITPLLTSPKPFKWVQELPPKRTHQLVVVSRIALVLFVSLHAINISYEPITGGLDPSWRYIINDAFSNHYPFIFTSGPLGFLNYPVDVGANLDIAVFIRVVVWLGFCVLFGYVVLRSKLPLPNLGVFALVFAYGGFLSFEYFLCFLILFLLARSMISKRWRTLYGISAALSAVLCLIKLTAGILAIACCVVFAMLVCFRHKEKRRFMLAWTWLGIPALFLAGYFLYNPSVSGVVSYIRGGFEISSGYNIAMSLPGQRRRSLMLAGLFAVIYLLFIRRFQKTENQMLFPAIAFLPAIFIAFKHGFVREDGHELIFFNFMPLLVGILVLFSDWRRLKRWFAALLIPVMIPCISPDFLWYKPSPNILHTLRRNSVILSGQYKLKTFGMVVRHGQTKQALADTSETALAPYQLPDEWNARIGDSVVGFFPWDAGYIPANGLNYVPFPVIQSYSAYTSYLDTLNAEYIAESDMAPEFILMEWGLLHGRHPLLDVPAMWLALYTWYDVAQQRHTDHSSLFLLQRREMPRFSELRELEHREVRIGEPVILPVSTQPLVMNLSMELSLVGQLTKIFFRIPPVTMEVVGYGGQETFRVIPDTLEDGLLINTVPLNLRDVYVLLNHDQAAMRVSAFTISGRGSALYKPHIQVKFSTIPDIALKPLLLPSLSEIAPLPSAPLANIERVRVHDAGAPGDDPAFVLVEGWAVDPSVQDVAGGVYVTIDGTPFPAYYGRPRPDVAEFFQIPRYMHSGFQAGIPITEIGSGEHKLVLNVLTRDQCGYYTLNQRVSFEIP